jgi:hypothetical protein
MNLRSPDRIVGNVALAARLCAASVDLCGVHGRHLARHGILIPHEFMGEVLARAGACLAAVGNEAATRRAELVDILATLEGAMEGGDRETCSVIGISFVWDGQEEPFFAALRPLLGPRMGALVRK